MMIMDDAGCTKARRESTGIGIGAKRGSYD
jgi:hypothetical protein